MKKLAASTLLIIFTLIQCQNCFGARRITVSKFIKPTSKTTQASKKPAVTPSPIPTTSSPPATSAIIPAIVINQNVPVKIDQTAKTVTVAPIGDVTTALNNALNFLINRTDKTTLWKVNFAAGTYTITKPLFADKLMNVSFNASPSTPALLKKSPSFAGEYLFYSRFSKNITIDGLQFYGITKTYNPNDYNSNSNPVWSDQGVYFGSANGITVTNSKFYDFGNAALRITTSETDPVLGVNSFNTTVTNNYFENNFQISTTSNSEKHGASANYLFQNNQMVNMHGSLKFASRTAGATNLKILNNKILGSDHAGIEICSYSNVEISGNEISNVKNIPINIYTNDSAVKGFPWGDNLTIRNNKIHHSYNGIRLSFNAYKDKYKYIPSQINITDNEINDIYDPSRPNSTTSAIYIINGSAKKVVITGNKLNRIASKNYFSFATGTGVTILNNSVDNASYNKYKFIQVN